MRKIHIIFALMAVLSLTLLTISCVKDLKDMGIFSTTEYIGTVVEKSTNSPIPSVKVQVTDGEHIHASATTGNDGSFNIKVNFDEIDDTYYLLLDGSPDLPIKQESLKGLGYEIYDYKMIVLYDKTDADLLPKVTTGEATSVLSYSATVSGSVVSNGGYALTERGICYATHQTPTISDMCVSAGAEMGNFSCNLSGLQKDVTYYARAYATNRLGTSYGQQISFSTDGLPTVKTNDPTKDGITVTAGGNVTSNGGSPVTARGVCYSRTPYPDLSSSHSHTTDGSGNGSYSSTFQMSVAGVYYVRAYATNANGTAYGEQKIVNHPYYDLPTFTMGGQVYRVAPPAPTTMSWNDAKNYCENLTLYGYTDWRLPTKAELIQMIYDKDAIGGLNNGMFWSGDYSYNSYYYAVWYDSYYNEPKYDYYSSGNNYYVRPIRLEN